MFSVCTNRKCLDVVHLIDQLPLLVLTDSFWREMSSFIGECEGTQWLGGVVAILAQGKVP